MPPSTPKMPVEAPRPNPGFELTARENIFPTIPNYQTGDSEDREDSQLLDHSSKDRRINQKRNAVREDVFEISMNEQSGEESVDLVLMTNFCELYPKGKCEWVREFNGEEINAN